MAAGGAAASRPAEAKPCKFFGSPKGCTNQNCPFLHAGNPSPGAAGSARVKRPANAAGQPCRFFASPTGCMNENCLFVHAAAGWSPSGANASGAAGVSANATWAGGAMSAGSTAATGGGKAADAKEPCKFFGSAKGCINVMCPFSHEAPNSVAPCSFKQRVGHCEKGDACTFRHIPWASPDQAARHYASRGAGVLETSTQRYKQLHRDHGPAKEKVQKEHVEVEVLVNKEIQVEAYGQTAMNMMEKMGYKAGSGLGKAEQGNTRLIESCMALERKSEKCALGFGNFSGTAKATVAERAARLADARAHKRPRLEETSFFTHTLLSEDESSDGEDRHMKSRDTKLKTA